MVTFEGEEWMFYPAFKVDVAIIRGSTADENGNLMVEDEGALLECLPLAQAARNSGGIVIAEVEYIARTGTCLLYTSRDRSKVIAWREAAVNHVASLTDRQRQIMNLVLAGHPSKNIAADLKISQRTVENHRASIMRKTGAASLPALARMAVAAEGAGDAAAKSVSYTHLSRTRSFRSGRWPARPAPRPAGCRCRPAPRR